METTKNKLVPELSVFFSSLSAYLQTKLYFFGSIQRNDYFPGLSDIDVDIFTNNEYSIIAKMQSYLKLKRCKFKKLIWKLPNDVFAHGYKVTYYFITESGEKYPIEFSIYNKKYKKNVLYEHNYKTNLPFYISWILIILKFLHYKLNLFEYSTYKNVKNRVLSNMMGFPKDKFVVLDSNPAITEQRINEVLVDW
jgi:predicted nucleotidyltransferase